VTDSEEVQATVALVLTTDGKVILTSTTHDMATVLSMLDSAFSAIYMEITPTDFPSHVH